MSDLDSIAKVLLLKKLAAEQALAAQTMIENSLKSKIGAMQQTIEEIGLYGPNVDLDSIGVADLQAQVAWRHSLHSRKKELEQALELVSERVHALKADLGELSGKNNLIDERIEAIAEDEFREQAQEQDARRLENWRMSKLFKRR